MTSFTLKEASLPELADRIRLLSVVLVVLFGIGSVMAVLSADPTSPLDENSRATAQLTTVGIYLLVALLFVLPLWRYVQWTSDLSRQAPAAEFNRSCIRLEKWIGALQILNILGLVGFSIGLIALLFTFRLDSKHVIDLLSGVAQVAYVILAARMFTSSLIYMAAVRNKTATLSAAILQHQLVQSILLTALVWVISVIQMALVKMEWPTMMVGFASMLVTLALMWISHRFIGQTAVQDSL